MSIRPLSRVFEAIGTHLDGPATRDLETTIGCDFGDVDERWLLVVRRGVAETRHLPPGAAFPDEAEVIVETSLSAFREILAGLRNPAIAAAGFSYPKRNAVALLATLRHFRPGARKLPALPRP